METDTSDVLSGDHYSNRRMLKSLREKKLALLSIWISRFEYLS
jgi:hypothetical protein